MNDIRQRLLGVFEIEQKEHLEQMRALMAHLQPLAGPGPELDEAFRHAHSLKGAARAVDLRQVEMLAHRLETLFGRVREGVLTPDLSVVDVIHQVLDAIEDAVASARQKPGAPAERQQALQAINVLLGLEPEPGAEPIVAPAAEPESWDAAASGNSAVPPGSGVAPPAPDTVRVRTATLDRLLASAGQLTTETLYQDRVHQQLRALRRSMAGMETERDRLRELAKVSLRRLAALPEFSRVARYLDAIDAQMRALSTQARDLGQSQRHSSWALRHLSKQLQEQVWRARVVPAETMFEGFRRMVRDLARDEGKQVEFHWTGLEVEADRMVLQALKDPLMHLLRNAVRHGIEPPQQRSQANKEHLGRVALRLETRGNRLQVAVDDDGRGLDLEAVVRVAVQKRILSEAEARSRSPDELGRLIFQPGLSTSPAVTELSGRGMGLSVVEQQVRRLHGELDLQFQGRTGTCITLLVPLTVSSQRFLLVGCRGQKLALPVHSIERLHRVSARDVETVEGKAVFPYQGRPLPLTTLAGLLGLAAEPAALDDAPLPVIVLRSGDTRLGVAVETFLEQREAVVHDLGLSPRHAGKSAGGIVLDDGAVAVVLNAAELVAAAKHSHLRVTPFAAPPRQEVKPPLILVVDDSITTRSLEKTILESQGYTVRVAVDGVEALERLRAEPADLVITDIQMPRMDGYGLLEEMKKDKQLAAIPVIVVTSMERREEQERGLLLGAAAYVVKRKFDQHELLEAVRQMV